MGHLVHRPNVTNVACHRQGPGLFAGWIENKHIQHPPSLVLETPEGEGHSSVERPVRNQTPKRGPKVGLVFWSPFWDVLSPRQHHLRTPKMCLDPCIGQEYLGVVMNKEAARIRVLATLGCPAAGSPSSMVLAERGGQAPCKAPTLITSRLCLHAQPPEKGGCSQMHPFLSWASFALSTPHTGQVSEFPFPLFLELGAFSQCQRYGLAFKALTDEQLVARKGTCH